MGSLAQGVEAFYANERHARQRKESVMSVILALTALLVLILVDQIRRSRQPRAAEAPVLVKRYVHPGHAWARETGEGDVLVGIDDFAQSILGSVDRVELPRLLRRVKQGTVAWRIGHGTRVIPIVSPVSGRVIEKNEMVLRDPSLVNAAPYGDGWLIRVRPRKLSDQLHNLLTGRPAQQWLDAARARLGRFFSGTPALMYQDGGVLVRDLAERCSDDEWSRLVNEFFLVDEHTTKY
jgi:glycine cleavage system H protein